MALRATLIFHSTVREVVLCGCADLVLCSATTGHATTALQIDFVSGTVKEAESAQLAVNA